MRPRRSNRLRRLEPSVQVRDATQRIGRIDISGDAENRVRRAIEVAVKRVHLVARERSEPRLSADSPPPHSVSIVQQLVQRLGCDRGRTVRFPFRFLDDDFHFLRQLAGVDHRVRVRVRLDVQSLRKTRRRQHGVVRGVVVDGVRIEEPAARLRLFREVSDATLLGPLEEHVLEGVRETLLVVGLVEVSGLHVGHDRDDRGRPVLLNENGQSIREHCSMNAVRIHCRERDGWRAVSLVCERSLTEEHKSEDEKKRPVGEQPDHVVGVCAAIRDETV